MFSNIQLLPQTPQYTCTNLHNGNYSGQQEDERVHHVLSQETIDRALAEDASRRQGQQQQASSQSSHSHSSHSQTQQSNRGDVVPGIIRRDTTTRRDPLTGDMIEDYSGSDPNGPAMRAHYDWDAPENTQAHSSSHSSHSHPSSNQQPRPGNLPRTNTTTSYNKSGDRVEEHDGEGSLEIRAMYNQDDDPSTTYRPQGPPRGQSEGGNRNHY